MNPQGPSINDMISPQMSASMIRQGGSPGQLFQQNPLSTGMQPGAMAADPGLMQQPQTGSQAQNPTMPSPQQSTQLPQPSEAEMLIKILGDRLSHHSKITQGTISTLQKMVEAGLPSPQDQGQQSSPPA